MNEQKQQLIAAGQFLFQQGWSPATSSNYSLKVAENEILVTVSGKHKGKLTEQDFLCVDLNGRPLPEYVTLKPSAETLLHTQIYKLFPEAGAVLHTHSVNATVLTRYLAEEPQLILSGYELLKAFPLIETHDISVAIPIVDNHQDMVALSDQLSPMLKQFVAQKSGVDVPPFAYLIRNHGLYTWGKTFDDALRHVEALEFLFQCELSFRRLGK